MDKKIKICKFRKKFDIDKAIGNFHISTFHHASFGKGKSKHWTELHCWYEGDCEHCPLSWEYRSYEGECYDCGCYMAEVGKYYPKTMLICMLPNWMKKVLLKYKQAMVENDADND
jgi:hypothetical protein